MKLKGLKVECSVGASGCMKASSRPGSRLPRNKVKLTFAALEERNRAPSSAQELDQKHTRFFQDYRHSSGQSPALATPSSRELCCCQYLPAWIQPGKLSCLVNSLLPHLDAAMSRAMKTWATSLTPPKPWNKAPGSGHMRKYQDNVFIHSFQYCSHPLNSPFWQPS